MADMYPQPDSPDETSADTPAQDGSQPGPSNQPDEEKMDGETALLPASILAGKNFKPGEEVVLKIVAVHGDEVEVSYAPEKSGDTREEADALATPDSNDNLASGKEMGAAQNRLSSMGGGY